MIIDKVRATPGWLRWATFVGTLLVSACDQSQVRPWHTVNLDREFSDRNSGDIHRLEDYLHLEDAVFAQLDQEIYQHSATGIEYALQRYSTGSIADPRQRKPNWNRTFVLEAQQPVGGVLLLHGMSDSPYSLRALGQSLQRRGLLVLGLRMPGHGTVPSGLTRLRWEDMSRVVNLGMDYLQRKLGKKPLHIIGYSTGAALALDYALENTTANAPASLVLISPAIGVSPAAALAVWKRRLSYLPGLGPLAWLDLEEEFDPYKYNSFATNAGEQVYRLTDSVSSRLEHRAASQRGNILPPTLVLKSTVDATVSNEAVLDRLLLHLLPDRHEMVLYDINRFAPILPLLISDPGPMTTRLIADETLPFTLTLVGNTESGNQGVSAYRKAPFSKKADRVDRLLSPWPQGVYSLSHVALPFPPDDPLYGRVPPDDKNSLFLGQLALQGERGILKISPSFLLRLRHNPFYAHLEQRVIDWIMLPAGKAE